MPYLLNFSDQARVFVSLHVRIVIHHKRTKMNVVTSQRVTQVIVCIRNVRYKENSRKISACHNKILDIP